MDILGEILKQVIAGASQPQAAPQRQQPQSRPAQPPTGMPSPDEGVIELPLAHISKGRVRVAEELSRVMGFAVLVPRDTDAALDGLFVEPEHWRRGIGRLLVEDAVARARAAGLAALDVVANGNALGFSEKLGFTVCGAAQTQFGPAKRLRRALISG